MCIYCQNNPNLRILTREGALLFTNPQKDIKIGNSPHDVVNYKTNAHVEEKRDRLVKHTGVACQNKLLCLTPCDITIRVL